jgi:hypothetical protein
MLQFRTFPKPVIKLITVFGGRPFTGPSARDYFPFRRDLQTRIQP